MTNTIAQLVLATNFFGLTVPIQDLEFLRAIAMVESGEEDRCIGRNGEVSRYQILPWIWKSYSPYPLTIDNIRDPNKSAHTCYLILKDHSDELMKITKDYPTIKEVYITYNYGFKRLRKHKYNFSRLPESVKCRAHRVENCYYNILRSRN